MESTTEVLEVGLWSFDSKSLIIKPWSPEANLDCEDFGHYSNLGSIFSFEVALMVCVTS